MGLYPLSASLYTFGKERINPAALSALSVIIRDGYEPEAYANLDFLYIDSNPAYRAGFYVLVSDFYFKTAIFYFDIAKGEATEKILDVLAVREDTEDFFNRDKALLTELGGVEVEALINA